MEFAKNSKLFEASVRFHSDRLYVNNLGSAGIKQLWYLCNNFVLLLALICFLCNLLQLNSTQLYCDILAAEQLNLNC